MGKSENPIKISLAGDLGSGKSTVSSLLLPELGAEYYSTGAIVRSIAEQHGMTVGELNVYMETHPEIDHEIDNGLVRLSDDPRLLIIDSRMAWHFTKNTFKVYLSADPMISAARILAADRSTERFASVEEAAENLRNRRKSEKKRYYDQYGVDITDFRNYDLILDTSFTTPEKVAYALKEAYRIFREDKSFRSVMISPNRLFYPDDEPDAELIAELTDKLEVGMDLPPVEVCEKDGDFYVISGVETVLASAMMSVDFVHATLVNGMPDCQNYVRMADSL